MIIATFNHDNIISESRFIKSAKKGEYLMEFHAFTLDGKLFRARTKIVDESYVRARLKTCRRLCGTIAVMKNGTVTYWCDYYYE